MSKFPGVIREKRLKEGGTLLKRIWKYVYVWSNMPTDYNRINSIIRNEGRMGNDALPIPPSPLHQPLNPPCPASIRKRNQKIIQQVQPHPPPFVSMLCASVQIICILIIFLILFLLPTKRWYLQVMLVVPLCQWWYLH